ncbi:MAG: ankyrin repeat domain-containing protein [bacterium]
MKRLVRVIGLIALIVGGVVLMPKAPPAWAAPSGRDAELLWRDSSGPKGERDPSALPLYQAVFALDAPLVASMLDHGVSPNAVLYPHRWSPLMVAAAYNNRQIAQLLVRHGADLNYVSDDQIHPTPLAVALAYGRFYPNIDHPDFAMLHDLLKSGADINVEFGYHQDIAKLAATLNQLKIVNELLEQGYHRDLPGLRKWIEIGHVDPRLRAEKDHAIEKIDRILRKK